MAFSIEAYFRYEDAVGFLVKVDPDQKVVNEIFLLILLVPNPSIQDLHLQLTYQKPANFLSAPCSIL